MYNRRDNDPPNTLLLSTTVTTNSTTTYQHQNTKSNNQIGKNRIPNSAIQEGYFHGFYGKQQQEYYGKYEIEFANHQKALAAQTQLDVHQPKNEFVHNKNAEFHHIKADFHQVKPELNHKVHEYHHSAKAQNFHQNQAYYNHHNVNHPNGNHQIPMQYTGQYYQSEYDAPSMDPAHYYDPKAQPGYYESINYHHTAEYPNEAYMTPTPSTNITDETFGYSQYYDGSSQNVHTTNAIGANHISQAHNQLHPHATNFIHHGPQPQPYPTQNPSANGNHSIAHNMENSNSSSDFNFLSNLANDFAPEYYQLS